MRSRPEFLLSRSRLLERRPRRRAAAATHSFPSSNCSSSCFARTVLLPVANSLMFATVVIVVAASLSTSLPPAEAFISQRQLPIRNALPTAGWQKLAPTKGATGTSWRYKNLEEEEEALEEEAEPLTGRLSNFTSRIRFLPWGALFSSRNNNKTEEPTAAAAAARVVRNVHELRRQVLQNKVPLRDVEFNLTAAAHHPVNATTVTADQLRNHAVVQLVAERVRANSTPGNRAPGDEAHLSLAIEGGGMRGAVSAGMAAAIASLGLSDVFDSIYGSSAGCIVGAYMISRQMCVDVYTEVLPAAGPMFASRGRVIGNVGVGYVSDLVSRLKEMGGATLGAANATASVVAVADNITKATAAPTGRMSRILSRVPVLNRAPSVLSSLGPYLTLSPGMNLTFVIDGIMSSTCGLRPFDLDTFRINDAKQPLRAVSSTVRGGKMETVAFGSEEGDFWDVWIEGYEEEMPKESRIKRFAKAVKTMMRSLVKKLTEARKSRNAVRRLLKLEKPERGPPIPRSKGMALLRRPRASSNKKRVVQLRRATSCPDNSGKKGFFACLESSMLVPGAAGPPVKLLRSKDRKHVKEYGVANMTSSCFDAFCYEPIPYRSAVENGATHVLALRSRPDGCFLEVKPYAYETIVAPVYFRLNGLPKVGKFFEKGGSQFRYVEDVLTLDEGLAAGCQDSSIRVKVPPTEILFGTDDDDSIVVEPESWSEAHLLPVICKAGTPELPSLTQEKSEVVNAVRDGYVAAFEMLAPIAGLQFDPKTVDSRRIAEMMFPIRDDEDVYVLGTPVQVKGDIIEKYEREERKRRRFAQWITRKRRERRFWKKSAIRNPFRAAVVEAEKENPGMVGGKKDNLDWLEAEALLAALPGFQSGKLPHLAGGLRSDAGRLISDSPANGTEYAVDRGSKA